MFLVSSATYWQSIGNYSSCYLFFTRTTKGRSMSAAIQKISDSNANYLPDRSFNPKTFLISHLSPGCVTRSSSPRTVSQFTDSHGQMLRRSLPPVTEKSSGLAILEMDKQLQPPDRANIKQLIRLIRLGLVLGNVA